MMLKLTVYLLLLVVSSTVEAKNKDCYVVYQSVGKEYSIVELQRTDTATVVVMRYVASPGDVFCLKKQALYLDDEKCRKYKLKDTVGIILGDTTRCPLSGVIQFSLVFEPLAKDVEIFDLRAANEHHAWFAFWGIHQRKYAIKKIKPTKERDIRLSGSDINLGLGHAVIKGKLLNYNQNDTLGIWLRTIEDEGSQEHESRYIETDVKEGGAFVFDVLVDSKCWTHIEGNRLKIPVMLCPNDTLELTIERLGEIDMKVTGKSAKGNDLMPSLMNADPSWVDWELAGERFIAIRPNVLNEILRNKKLEVRKLVDYLTWKHKLNNVETHLLRLQMYGFLDEIAITRMKANFNDVYFQKDGTLDSDKIRKQIDESPETAIGYGFLKDITPADYSYFILPRQYLLSHLSKIYTYGYCSRDEKFELLEKYIGKPLDEEWRKRINF